MISFATDVITRLRAPFVTDSYGNHVLDWSTPAELTITGCRVQPLQSNEYTTDSERIAVRLRTFAPAGSDVTGVDRIRFNGIDYSVDGDPLAWSSPTGGLAHLEFFIERVT